MKFQIVLTREAEQNVRSVLAWYADQSQSAADRWYAEFAKAVDALSEYPDRYTWGAREFPIPN